ncbi:hypothetical protein GPJ56_007371 [Histomonas meleagridis]|uniref:uncharacterized protein n=1 Tax=Histomonas meleagridis TaxID=135588 RepID=UPI00355A638B|nr:hypothetical protein GPJ56_007371 [Histomonas meleagridis]KAH0804217.1 hypothetical protein GO595_003047 [Histomonas meleagridis]
MSFSTNSSSKRQPKQQQDLFETTNIAFPSPSHDTQSIIQSTPNFYKRSVYANKFKNDTFNPTSPIDFSDSYQQSNDADFKLFLPQSSLSPQDENIDHANITIPSLLDLVDDYNSYLQAHLPPAISFSDLLGYFSSLKFSPLPRLPSKLLVSKNYSQNFYNLQKIIESEISSIHQEITSRIRGHNKNPPYLLSTIPQLSSEDTEIILNRIKDYITVFHTESTKAINEQLFNLEKISFDESHSFEVLDRQLNSAKSILKNNPKIAKYDKYVELTTNINETRDATKKLSQYRAKFSFLNKCISFHITKIERGKAVIGIPQLKELYTAETVKSVHCLIANEKRKKDLIKEIHSISSVLPYMRQEENIVYFTFVKHDPRIRFEVGFQIPQSYPWGKIRAATRILEGPDSITFEINTICGNQNFTNKPLQAICEQIIRKLEIFE